jgi:type I restriction-modification system DNA methylase subunit
MSAIESFKPELEDVLPKDEYFQLMPDNSSSLLKSLLKTFADIPADADGDIFGQIYEYFLGNFALAEGQGGGEFFTPKSVVKVMVEIIEPIAQQVIEVLDGTTEIVAEEKTAVSGLVKGWKQLGKFRKAYDKYLEEHSDQSDVAVHNKAQRTLAESLAPFFGALHTELKSRLERLHSEIRNAESFFSHVAWLQERFPSAKYEDVTGLCKLSSLAEIKEQDYSLNPGRYVGVVIEEDGKTEEEFIEGLAEMQATLKALDTEATELSSVIRHNVKQLIGDE